MPDTKKAVKDNQDDLKSIDDYLDEPWRKRFRQATLSQSADRDKKTPLNRDRNKETGLQ